MASPLRPLRAEKCNPCLRNVLLPMSRNGHKGSEQVSRKQQVLPSANLTRRFEASYRAAGTLRQPCGMMPTCARLIARVTTIETRSRSDEQSQRHTTHLPPPSCHPTGTTGPLPKWGRRSTVRIEKRMIANFFSQVRGGPSPSHLGGGGDGL